MPPALLAADPFVGRTDVLAALLAHADAAAAGRGSFVIVGGPAGIGKSRVGAELALRLASGVPATPPARVVGTRCWTHAGAPPLWPWHDLIRRLGPGPAPAPAPTGGRAGEDRFAFFEAVAARMQAEAEDGPLVLLLDDLQAADEGTLLATRFVAERVAHARILLVGMMRDGAAVTGSSGGREATLGQALIQEARTITLAGLSRVEVAELARAEGRDPEPGAVSVLTELTGGNPLALRTILRAAPPGPLTEALPRGVAEAVAWRRRDAEGDAIDLLARAALLGGRVAIDEVAEACRVTTGQVRRAMAVGIDLDLVRPGAPDELTFSHDLVRDALLGELPADERQEIHATAVKVIEARDPTPAGALRAANHALHAAGRSPRDRAEALDRAGAAAAELMAGHAFADADGLLSRAVTIARRTGDGTAPASLLCLRAEAVMLAGRVAEAQQRYLEAVEAAAADGDPLLIAEAAAGLGGIWVNNVRAPVEQQRVLRWQREALAALPAGHDGLALRLRSRIASEAAFWEGAGSAALVAVVDDARCSPDPAVRLEVLSNVHTALLGPQWTSMRLAMAAEMMRDTGVVSAGIFPLMARCWRAVDLFLAGDAAAERALADLRAPAEALQCTSVLYVVRVLEVMLAIRAGHLDEAERLAGAAHALGQRAQDADASAYYAVQLLTIRWFQGRDDELIDLVEQMASSPERLAGDPSTDAAVAALAARAGRLDLARRHLHRLTKEPGLTRLPRYSTWLATLCGIIEAAAALGEAGTARAAYDLLLPHAHLPVAPSLAVTCLGSAQRFLGLAAAAIGEVDTAVAHLEAAVAANVHLGHRPAAAMARADLADLLARRGRGSDRDRAAELWDDAIAAGDEAQLGRLTERWREHRRTLGNRCEPPAAGPIPLSITRADGDGGAWLVALGEEKVSLPNRAGLRHLAMLVRSPDQPRSALALAADEPGGLRVGPRQAVIDPRAEDALEARARQLAAAIADARGRGDELRQRRYEDELDALTDELRRCAGPAGRTRAFTDEAERARTSVRKAIMRAIAEIERALPAAGVHLRATISTGTSCCYRPDAARERERPVA